MTEPTQTRVPISALIISPPGGGKTTFGCSFPEVFVFDFDYGLTKYRVQGNAPMHVRPSTWQETLLWTMRISRGEPLEVPGYAPAVPKTVFVDTVNEAYNLAMTTILSIDPKKMIFSKVGDNILHNPNTQREMSGQQDFGLAFTRVINWIRDLRDASNRLGFNLVVASHEEVSEEKTTKQIGGACALPGKIKFRLPGFFDIYGRLLGKTMNSPVRLQTIADDLFPLKDRLGLLPPLLENPSHSELCKYIYEGKQK